MRKALLLLLVLFLLSMGSVVSVEENPLVQGFVEGYINNVTTDADNLSGQNSVLIETYQGSFYELPLRPNASITIDQRPVQLSELRKNMEVYALLEGRQIVSIEAFATMHMGYIQPGSQMVQGSVTQITPGTIEIKKTDGSLGQYIWSNAIPMTRKGMAVSADSIYIGDRVKLFFDEINVPNVSRIEIEGDSELVQGIYRANLTAIGENTRLVTLRNIEIFRDNNWSLQKPSQMLPYNNNLALYSGGIKISDRNIKYYTGKDVYYITKNILGRETIDRLLVQSQHISNDSARIDSINWFIQAFELNNKKNIAFNESSIIIKDGRLQDYNILTPGMDAFVISDGSSSGRVAYIVNISGSDVNNTNIGKDHVYAGRIEQVFDDAIHLENTYELTDNVWIKAYEKELIMDSGTVVYDTETQSMISAKQLASGNYSSGNWSQNDKLSSWYAYVYVNDERVTGMTILKDEDIPDEHRVTTAIVLSVENDPLVGPVANLYDCRDWSDRRQQWMPRNSVLRLGLGEALIVMETNTIVNRYNMLVNPFELVEIDKPSELLPGSHLLISRDDFMAKVVLVKIRNDY